MRSTDVRLHVGQGTTRGALSVFPVWTDAPASARGYRTGTEAPVDVAERAGTPVVEELVVTGRADRPVLLLAGELLEGGWQDRALTATHLLAPQRPTVLPVVCVEQGRWHGAAAHRRAARRVPVAVLPRLRSQQAVWERVRRYEAVAGGSATESLTDRFDNVATTTAAMTRGLRPLAGQRGVLVGIAGRPAWLELFDSPRTLAAHWAGLVQAAALDALGRPEVRTPAAAARAFAERLERTRLAPDGPAGLGRRLRSTGRLAVDAVRWDHRTLHLTAVDLTHPLQEA
ncbi:ARPP-1 family domain-containing protein [Geodermatophilus sp. SYSU D00815]